MRKEARKISVYSHRYLIILLITLYLELKYLNIESAIIKYHEFEIY